MNKKQNKNKEVNSTVNIDYIPIKIECWKAEDGKIFEQEDRAINYQKVIEQTRRANKVFENGVSVAEAMRIAGYEYEIDPMLEHITKNTKLVISHWQCRDEPGYMPQYFEDGLCSMFVYGYAGSWSGAYGNSVKLNDLIMYANNKRTDFGV